LAGAAGFAAAPADLARAAALRGFDHDAMTVIPGLRTRFPAQGPTVVTTDISGKLTGAHVIEEEAVHPALTGAGAAKRSREIQEDGAAAQLATAHRSGEAGAVGLGWLWELVADGQQLPPLPTTCNPSETTPARYVMSDARTSPATQARHRQP